MREEVIERIVKILMSARTQFIILYMPEHYMDNDSEFAGIQHGLSAKQHELNSLLEETKYTKEEFGEALIRVTTYCIKKLMIQSNMGSDIKPTYPPTSDGE